MNSEWLTQKERDKREEFIKKQKECCDRHNAPHFMHKSGICYYCKGDVALAEIKRGNDGSELVTGCLLCNRSYCD